MSDEAKTTTPSAANKPVPATPGPVRDKFGRFVPGHSGNPGGKPKGKPQIPDMLRRISKERVKLQGRYVTKLEALLRTAFMQAIKGDAKAREFIADRMEGKAIDRVIQQIDLSGGAVVPRAIAGGTVVPEPDEPEGREED